MKRILFVLLFLLPVTSYAQQGATVYTSIGTSREVTQANITVTGPTVLVGIPDQSVYDAAFNTCMSPPPPATPSSMLCAMSAASAQAADLAKRAEIVIQLFYNFNPTAADTFLSQYNLFLIKR